MYSSRLYENASLESWVAILGSKVATSHQKEGSALIPKLILIAGDHSMLVTRLIEGRRAGRYALAYRFHNVWRFVTDVDTDELLTWKTEEEALIIGDAWRTAWETIKFPAPERAKRAKHAR